MKIFIALAIVSVAQCSLVLEDVNTEWVKFKDNYGKIYKNTIEERMRKSVFTENYKLIKNHNELYKQGEVSYFLKINKFADTTEQERKLSLKGLKIQKLSDVVNNTFVPDPNIEVPDSFDWREKHAVTDVKDQGGCGSCWAFSATGSLETQHFLKTGKLVSISEQNLVDCSHEDENLGCNGGWMNSAFKYVWKNDGIDSEATYPYEGSDGKCRYTVDGNVTSLRGFSTIELGNEIHLKAAIAQVGSVSVAIDASKGDFSFYGGGVYYNEHCKDGTVDPENDLDHGVLAVGYGSENGKDYFIVKNSWSALWGEKGYIRMSRNKKNNCGIATLASFPLLYN